MPGTAKTLLVRVIARLFGCAFKRVQFTPDLMPADITGTNVFDPRDQTFNFRPGPIFAAQLLPRRRDQPPRRPKRNPARSSKRCKSGRSPWTASPTRCPPAVFTVFATQNPIEQEGTYPLPEAQLDRFMMKALAGYPNEEDEIEVLRVHQRGARVEDLDRFNLKVVGGEAELLAAQAEVRARTIRDELLGYISGLVRGTRDNLKVEVGASPRAGLMLLTAAKARAAPVGPRARAARLT